jgi:IS30 family transposase
MTRRERPLLGEERESIRRLHTTGMSAATIATALFLGKRQVQYVIAHPDPEDDTEAVTT